MAKLNISKELDLILSDKREFEIMTKRSQGKTLQEIGNELGITRERVRQIELGRKKKIFDLFTLYSDQIKKAIIEKDFAAEGNAESFFGEDVWPIIKYAIKSGKEFERANWRYLKETNEVYFSDKDFSLVFEIIKDNLSDGMDKEDAESLVLEKMKDIGMKDLSIDRASKFIKASGYYSYPYSYTSRKATVSHAIEEVARIEKKEYDISDEEEINRLLNLALDRYRLTGSTRQSFVTRMQEVLMLTNRGAYSSPDLLEIDKDLIEEIESMVKNSKNGVVSFGVAFDKLEKELLERSSIRNKYYLHGACKVLVEKGLIDLECDRYFLRKKGREPVDSNGHFLILYNFLMEKAEPVKESEIYNKFNLWEKDGLNYASKYYPSIMSWGEGLIFNTDSIRWSKDEEDYILRVLDDLTKNSLGYTSSHALYNKIIKERPDIAKKAFSDNHIHFLHASKKLFEDKFFIKRPHIVKGSNRSDFVTKDLVLGVLDETQDVFTKSDILENLYELFGVKVSSLNISLQKILDSGRFIRIDSNSYVKSDIYFKKNKDIINTIGKYLSNFFEENQVLNKDTLADYESKINIGFWELIDLSKKFLSKTYLVSGSSLNPSLERKEEDERNT